MGKDKAEVENAAYGAFCVRIVRGLAKRVGAGDPEDLQIIRELRSALRQAEDEAMVGLYEQGWSCSQIGKAIGITRQSVHERLFKPAPSTTPPSPLV